MPTSILVNAEPAPDKNAKAPETTTGSMKTHLSNVCRVSTGP